MITRRIALAGLGSSAFAITGAAAQVGSRIGQLIVPFPAGSLTDIVARQIADRLGPAMGYRLVIDNRAGAQGAIGMKAAAAAPADGSTLVCVGVTTAASNPVLLNNAGYDPVRDFAQVGMIAECPYLLVAAPDLPVKTAADLMELARRDPGRISYSYGSGSARVAAELLAKRAGVQVLGVPYKGGLEALTDVMAGRIGYTFTDFANGLTQIRDGKVKGLAVSSAATFGLAPELPTVEASGLAPFDVTVWFGMAVPAKTPPDIVRLVAEKLGDVLRDRTLVDRFAGQGLLVRTSSPEAFDRFVRREGEKWGALARETGLAAS